MLHLWFFAIGDLEHDEFEGKTKLVQCGALPKYAPTYLLIFRLFQHLIYFITYYVNNCQLFNAYHLHPDFKTILL